MGNAATLARVRTEDGNKFVVKQNNSQALGASPQGILYQYDGGLDELERFDSGGSYGHKPPERILQDALDRIEFYDESGIDDIQREF